MKPMKSSAPDDKYPLEFPLLGSPKFDGFRAVVTTSGVMSNSLKPHTNRYVQEQFGHLLGADGELIVGAPNDEGTFARTSSGCRRHEGQPDVYFYVFDDWRAGLTTPYSKRFRPSEFEAHPRVRIVQQTLIHNQVELEDFYQRHLEAGYEGVMLRKPDGLYLFGRATAKQQTLLKVKPFEDAEAVVVSCYEAMENTNEATTDELGRTKRSSHAAGKVPKDTLGGFSCIDVKTQAPFNVAPGVLTHEQRKLLWEQWKSAPHTLVDQYLTYRSLPIGVVDAPRHGRFMRWRPAVDVAEAAV